MAHTAAHNLPPAPGENMDALDDILDGDNGGPSRGWDDTDFSPTYNSGPKQGQKRSPLARARRKLQTVGFDPDYRPYDDPDAAPIPLDDVGAAADEQPAAPADANTVPTQREDRAGRRQRRQRERAQAALSDTQELHDGTDHDAEDDVEVIDEADAQQRLPRRMRRQLERREEIRRARLAAQPRPEHGAQITEADAEPATVPLRIPSQPVATAAPEAAPTGSQNVREVLNEHDQRAFDVMRHDVNQQFYLSEEDREAALRWMDRARANGQNAAAIRDALLQRPAIIEANHRLYEEQQGIDAQAATTENQALDFGEVDPDAFDAPASHRSHRKRSGLRAKANQLSWQIPGALKVPEKLKNNRVARRIGQAALIAGGAILLAKASADIVTELAGGGAMARANERVADFAQVHPGAPKGDSWEQVKAWASQGHGDNWDKAKELAGAHGQAAASGHQHVPSMGEVMGLNGNHAGTAAEHMPMARPAVPVHGHEALQTPAPNTHGMGTAAGQEILGQHHGVGEVVTLPSYNPSTGEGTIWDIAKQHTGVGNTPDFKLSNEQLHRVINENHRILDLNGLNLEDARKLRPGAQIRT